MNLIEKIFKIDKTRFKRKCDYEVAILKKNFSTICFNTTPYTFVILNWTSCFF